MLNAWEPSFVNDEPGVSVSNRYFQAKSGILPEDVVPFSEEVDPEGILTSLVDENTVHTIHNQVEYYERIPAAENSQR